MSVCATDDDCTLGICNDNGVCECDEDQGYKLVRFRETHSLSQFSGEIKQHYSNKHSLATSPIQDFTIVTLINSNKVLYLQADHAPSVCELVSCKEDYCKNNGVCSQKGIELECKCPIGADGDHCGNFIS